MCTHTHESINSINTALHGPFRLQQWHMQLLILEVETLYIYSNNFDSLLTLHAALFPLLPCHFKLEPRLLTLSTSIGTWAAGGKLAGTLTLMAGVWAAVVCGYWQACCLCCSRRSCSWSCSRISCCRSRMRDVMAEELSGGLEEPCWSGGLLPRGETCQMNEPRQWEWGCEDSEGRAKGGLDREWQQREGSERSDEEGEVKRERQERRKISR